jgi:hypothetical protein
VRRLDSGMRDHQPQAHDRNRRQHRHAVNEAGPQD